MRLIKCVIKGESRRQEKANVYVAETAMEMQSWGVVREKDLCAQLIVSHFQNDLELIL